MSQKNYSGSLALTKMKCAIITTKKGNKAILLPIDFEFSIILFFLFDATNLR